MAASKKGDGKPFPYQSSFHPFKSEMAKDEYVEYYRRTEATWPIPFEDLTVETSYGSTYVRTCGPADARPLVLLPGDTECSLC